VLLFIAATVWCDHDGRTCDCTNSIIMLLSMLLLIPRKADLRPTHAAQLLQRGLSAGAAALVSSLSDEHQVEGDMGPESGDILQRHHQHDLPKSRYPEAGLKAFQVDPVASDGLIKVLVIAVCSADDVCILGGPMNAPGRAPSEPPRMTPGTPQVLEHINRHDVVGGSGSALPRYLQLWRALDRRKPEAACGEMSSRNVVLMPPAGRSPADANVKQPAARHGADTRSSRIRLQGGPDRFGRSPVMWPDQSGV
jgi:hypothetical protein